MCTNCGPLVILSIISSTDLEYFFHQQSVDNLTYSIQKLLTLNIATVTGAQTEATLVRRSTVERNALCPIQSETRVAVPSTSVFVDFERLKIIQKLLYNLKKALFDGTYVINLKNYFST